MQKLLHFKLASSISKKLSNSSSNYTVMLHSTFYKKLSCSHYRTLATSSAARHSPHFPSSSSWLSKISFSQKVHGFFTCPSLAKQFLTSLCFRTPCKLYNSGLLKAELPKKRFHTDPFESLIHEWKSWFSQFSSDNVILGLIMANGAVFMLWRIADQKFMTRHFTISVDNFKSGRVHTMITSAFSHVDMGHILSNMFGLYLFGTSTARYFGPEYLLKLYLAGAIGGSIFYLVHHAFMSSSSKRGGLWSMDPSRTPGLGASGAVNAIMLLNIFLFPKATLYFKFIIPVPAILLGIFLIGQDMLRIIEGDSQISGSAHLGGAVVAALAWRRVKMGRF